MKQSKHNDQDKQVKQQVKKSYEKPQLLPLGDIRDVTMGGSPGFGDSGAAMPEKPF